MTNPEDKALRFRITTRKGETFTGEVQGSGGVLGAGMMHLPRPSREVTELSRLRRIARSYAKTGGPLLIYEPEPGCVCVFPDGSGYHQPRHHVSISGASIELEKPRPGTTANLLEGIGF